ncbi:MAG: tRNA (adenosine(37)-N6)-dimethylallyltransferase MiaA [Actinomycetota bacterium]
MTQPKHLDIKVVAIVGATASGKSEAAIILAERVNGEIVSADSMQVYRGLDIGTAKPDAATQARVPHHLIDILDLTGEFSAAAFQTAARRDIKEIHNSGRLPIVVGGTGLYVSAALDNMSFPRTGQTSSVRARLEKDAARLGSEGLYARLKSVDPKAASIIHPNNIRRIVRALEVCELTGRPFSEAAGGFKNRQSVYDTTFVGIKRASEDLRQRIDRRVDRMLKDGWAEEAANVMSGRGRISRTAERALGYKEALAYARGELTLTEATARIKKVTWAYARRQMTWFRADSRIFWIAAGRDEGAETLAGRVEWYLKRQEKVDM